MTTEKECAWFLDCHDEAIAQVDHPTLGWVDICGKHCDWLVEDATENGPNPTKMVPPLAAKHGERVRQILADLEDE